MTGEPISRRFFSVASALAALAWASAPSVARAQEPWHHDASSTAPLAPTPIAPPPTIPSTDPLIIPGAALTAVGLTSTVGGALAIWAGGRPCTSCPFSLRTPAQDDLFIFGSTMLGGGIGVLAIGAPTLIVGLTRDPRPDTGARGRTVGLTLVVTGAASLGAGIGALVGEASHGSGKGASIPLSIASIGIGTVLIPVGAPIWALSGRQAEPAAPAPSRSSAESMRYVGIALTIIGGAGTIAGLVTTVALAKERGDFAGLAAAVIGGSILGGSTVFLGVGIPLWVIGAKRLGKTSPSPALVPSLRMGPRYAEATWQF